MPVYPQQPQQRRPIPPPESLQRVSASMQAPQPFSITDYQTGLPYDPNAPRATPPPQPQPQSPPQQQGLGPLIPPRETPASRRLKEWRDSGFQEGFFNKPPKKRFGIPERAWKSKFERARVEKGMRDADKKMGKALKRVTDLMRLIDEATGVGFEGAEGVSGASAGFPRQAPSRFPEPPTRFAPPPIRGGGYSVPVPMSGGQLPNMGPPPQFGIDQPAGRYGR